MFDSYIQYKLRNLPENVKGRRITFKDADTGQILGYSFENYTLEQDKQFSINLWINHGISICDLEDQGRKDIREAIGVFRNKFGEDASWLRVQGFIGDERVY